MFSRSLVSIGVLLFGLLPNPVAAEADPLLLEGFRRYHSVCNHCHGPDGLGSSFGPALVDAMPDPKRFREAVLDGVQSASGGMKGFAGNPNVTEHLDAIFAYIEARASGALGRGRPGR